MIHTKYMNDSLLNWVDMPLIGYPVWYGDGNIRRRITTLRRYGFDYVEIDLETITPSVIKTRPQLPAGYHAPYTIPLAHQYLGEEVTEKMTNIVKFVSKLGGEYINIHANYPKYRGLEELNTKLLKNAVKLLKKLKRENPHLAITLENTLGGDYWDCNSLSNMVEKTGLLMCLDIGHMASKLLEEGKDVGRITNELRRCIRRNKQKLYLIHLHNITETMERRKTQDHLLHGELELTEIIEPLNDTNCRYVLIETFFRDLSRRKAPIREVARLAREIRKVLSR